MVEVEDLDEEDDSIEAQHKRLKEEAAWDDNNRELLAKGQKAITFEEWKGVQEIDETDPKAAKGDPEALLKDVKVQKEVGFGAYRTGNYEKALVCWSMAKETLQQLVDKKRFIKKEEKDNECKDLLFTLNLNLAQAYLKNKEFGKALVCSEWILAKEPQNTKALYRKASAQLMKSDFKEAKETTQALLEVEPDNAAGKQLLHDIAQKAKTSTAKSKRASKKIFGAFDGTDPRTVEYESRPEEVISYEERFFDFLEDVYLKITGCCRKRKKTL